MKNFLLAVIAVFMFACPAIAQDRAEILAQVAALKDLSLCNAETIAKVDTRVGTLERAVFGYTETYEVQEPVTVMRAVKKTRTVPPLVISKVQSVTTKSTITEICPDPIPMSYSAPVQMVYPQAAASPVIVENVGRYVNRTRNVYGSTDVFSRNMGQGKASSTKTQSAAPQRRRGPIRRLFSGGQARSVAACPS